jgi:hypothetical protein
LIELLAGVVLSAIVPTAIAQRFFHPHAEPERDRASERPVVPMPSAAATAREGAES